MMKSTTLLIFLFFILLSSRLANGDSFYLKGDDLYKICSLEKSSSQKECHAFLLGVLDGRITYMGEWARAEGKSPSFGICYPRRESSISDLQVAVIKEIDSNRSLYESARAGFVIISAIRKNFPCESKGK